MMAATVGGPSSYATGVCMDGVFVGSFGSEMLREPTAQTKVSCRLLPGSAARGGKLTMELRRGAMVVTAPATVMGGRDVGMIQDMVPCAETPENFVTVGADGAVSLRVRRTVPPGGTAAGDPTKPYTPVRNGCVMRPSTMGEMRVLLENGDVCEGIRNNRGGEKGAPASGVVVGTSALRGRACRLVDGSYSSATVQVEIDNAFPTPAAAGAAVVSASAAPADAGVRAGRGWFRNIFAAAPKEDKKKEKESDDRKFSVKPIASPAPSAAPSSSPVASAASSAAAAVSSAAATIVAAVSAEPAVIRMSGTVSGVQPCDGVAVFSSGGGGFVLLSTAPATPPASVQSA